MAIHKKSKNLFLIDLDQKLPGFRKFISSWLYTKDHKNIIIDPGPTSTIPVLEKALADLNIHKVDYILLTHIHIDHAGGTGLLLSKFPDSKVLCHPMGIPHMINPEKLWQGSLALYVARMLPSLFHQSPVPLAFPERPLREWDLLSILPIYMPIRQLMFSFS